jgi:hypothetical protein
MFAKGNGAPSKCIGYGLCLHFLGLPFGNASKALSFLHIVKGNHVAVCKRIQKHKPKKMSKKGTRIKSVLLTKPSSRSALGISGYGLPLNQKLNIPAISNKHTQGKKHVCCRAFFIECCAWIWKTPCFS